MAYGKKEAIKIVSDAAGVYFSELCNRNFLVIYRDRKTTHIKWFECLFLPRNFQHLTGLEYIDQSGKLQHKSVEFFNKSRVHMLKEEEVQFKNDGTSQLKLKALPKIINFCKSSKMTTTVDTYRPLLNVDRLTGNVHCCLGFVKENDYYYPASCLLGDIRDFGDNPSQILAVLCKPVNEKNYTYSALKYQAKGVDLRQVGLPARLTEMITD